MTGNLNDSPKKWCRLCNSDDQVTIQSDIKTRLGEIYSLIQCRACSFVTIAPLPSPDNLKRYYNRHYWSHGNGETSRLLGRFYAVRMARIIKHIKQSVSPKARILDWGAGDGSLMRLFDQHGFDSYGIDNFSSPKNLHKFVRASIEKAPFADEVFDGITCFHVLEHIINPVPSVTSALKLLKPGGIFVVEVPNIASWGFRLFRQYWHQLDIPVHVNHFNPSVLQRIIEDAGPVETIRANYYSNRHSPSSLLLSFLPAISPPRVRARFSGNFPMFLKVLYLVLQMMVYPFARLGAFTGRGEIIQMVFRKKATL